MLAGKPVSVFYRVWEVSFKRLRGLVGDVDKGPIRVRKGAVRSLENGGLCQGGLRQRPHDHLPLLLPERRGGALEAADRGSPHRPAPAGAVKIVCRRGGWVSLGGFRATPAGGR